MEKRKIGTLTDGGVLDRQVETPERPHGILVFAHGSGSSRHSPRNVHVAEVLQHSGFATLLFDLLTEHESADRRHVFDIPVLARRLRCAAEAVRALAPASALPMGYFGASTGAAAALVAAATDPRIGAVVSRGGLLGRPTEQRERRTRQLCVREEQIVGMLKEIAARGQRDPSQARTVSAGGPVAGMGTPYAPARVLVVRTDEKLRAARGPRATVHPAAFG